MPSRLELNNFVDGRLTISLVLRLYPSVPVNSRTAVRSVTLPRGGGKDGQHPVLIHKGEDVAYCAYAMHRRKDIYGDDAEEFKPKRWEDGQLKHVENSYGYIPFNGGPRVCPGRKSFMSHHSVVWLTSKQRTSRSLRHYTQLYALYRLLIA
jgi:cytochrome P450